MANIRPFKAIRPDKEYADKIAALPYDVYSREEAKEAVKGKDDTFLRIDRAETNFDYDIDLYSDKVYAKANELLQEMIKDGRFIKDNKPYYYVYELTMEGRVQTGIVAASSVDDYVNEVIKKHENTRAEKEADRINHVNICSAQTGPIFLAYRDREAIDEVVHRVKKGDAVYDFVADDGVRHRVFLIDDEDDIATIQGEFNKTDSIYIADGHHRAASAVKVGLRKREENPGYTGEEEFNFFLSVLFPESELKILPYNRVVKDLKGMSKDEFFTELSKVYDIKEVEAAYQPEEKGYVGMFIEGSWYELKIHDELKCDDPVEGLDVSLLQNHVLNPILGIEDPRTDSRIAFVGGIRGLGELERRVNTDMKVAFSMYPTSIGELFDVADAGLLMPPKSTWFEPKLRSGIFIHRLDEE